VLGEEEVDFVIVPFSINEALEEYRNFRRKKTLLHGGRGFKFKGCGAIGSPRQLPLKLDSPLFCHSRCSALMRNWTIFSAIFVPIHSILTTHTSLLWSS
jgi:hypothetical protein